MQWEALGSLLTEYKPVVVVLEREELLHFDLIGWQFQDDIP
jgi:hypothetical protein